MRPSADLHRTPVTADGADALLAGVAGAALIPGDQNLLRRSLLTEPPDFAPGSRSGEGRRCRSLRRADGPGLPSQDPVCLFLFPCVFTIWRFIPFVFR